MQQWIFTVSRAVYASLLAKHGQPLVRACSCIIHLDATRSRREIRGCEGCRGRTNDGEEAGDAIKTASLLTITIPVALAD